MREPVANGSLLAPLLRKLAFFVIPPPPLGGFTKWAWSPTKLTGPRALVVVQVALDGNATPFGSVAPAGQAVLAGAKYRPLRSSSLLRERRAASRGST